MSQIRKILLFIHKYIYKPKGKTGASRKQAWEAYKGRGVMPDFAASTLEKMCGILSSTPATITFDGKAQNLEFLRDYATPYHDGLDALADRVRRNILRSGRHCLLLEPDESEDIGFHINEYKCRKYLRARTISSGGETYADMVLLDTSEMCLHRCDRGCCVQLNDRLFPDLFKT